MAAEPWNKTKGASTKRLGQGHLVQSEKSRLHIRVKCSLTTTIASRSVKAAPTMFAVNIETNGNPHHRPWTIGKRLLSSWLPVRSAKDQGGAKVTHTL